MREGSLCIYVILECNLVVMHIMRTLVLKALLDPSLLQGKRVSCYFIYALLSDKEDEKREDFA